LLKFREVEELHKKKEEEEASNSKENNRESREEDKETTTDQDDLYKFKGPGVTVFTLEESQLMRLHFRDMITGQNLLIRQKDVEGRLKNNQKIKQDVGQTWFGKASYQGQK